MALNTAVILAAGAGTRMKSKIPKVLHKVCGLSMIESVIKEVKSSHIENIIVVIGNGAEAVEEELSDMNVSFVLQKEQLGTGHAVLQAKDSIPDSGDVIVLCGDMPLITQETIKAFMRYHKENNHDISILTAELENPFGYGRIVKDDNGLVNKIVEQKDASEDELLIKEVNSGVYCFKAGILKKHLADIDNRNAQNEYYLTDLIEIGVRNKYDIGAFSLSDPKEIMGVNSRKQLAEAESLMRQRIVEKLMESGVSFIDTSNCYIDKEVEVGMDTVIYPGVILKGKTIIGENCIIGQNSRIENGTIEDNVKIQSSVIIDSIVRKGTNIGPFAYLRPGSSIGQNVKIGDFVEVKNASIGDGSKASHLAYIGDAEVGKNVNIGCGVIFVNYDGKNKNKITVEDDAFIGSNVNLIAPVTVRKRGFVAAGTTVTLEVPDGALCIGREKQKHIKNWVDRKKIKE